MPAHRVAAAEPAAGNDDLSRPRLVIVIPDAFEPALDEYVQYRSQKYQVQVIRLSQALSGPGVDGPERLKRCLYRLWQQPGGPLAVLLVGDADQIPVRYMVLDRVTEPAFDYAFYPSDHYYADVARDDGSFDDWNASKEGFHANYFGEVRGEKHKDDPINFDQVSYVPELAVGRWPVSSVAEITAVIGKTLAYERGLSEQTARRGKALAVMVGGWIDARPQMDQFASGLEPQFEVERLFFRDANPRWIESIEPTAAAVLARLSSPEPVRIVLHAGHGQDHAWESCISTADLLALRQTASPAVVMSAGCSTARFATLPPYEAYVDTEGTIHAGTNHGEVFREPPPPPSVYARGIYNKSGLGEELVRLETGGAVVYIGCNTGSQPAAMTLMAGLADALSAGPLKFPTVGDCWKHALGEYYRREHLAQLKPTESWYPASIFFQGMKFMYFGDPCVGY
jgi:hypothetical protein